MLRHGWDPALASIGLVDKRFVWIERCWGCSRVALWGCGGGLYHGATLSLKSQRLVGDFLCRVCDGVRHVVWVYFLIGTWLEKIVNKYTIHYETGLHKNSCLTLTFTITRHLTTLMSRVPIPYSTMCLLFHFLRFFCSIYPCPLAWYFGNVIANFFPFFLFYWGLTARTYVRAGPNNPTRGDSRQAPETVVHLKSRPVNLDSSNLYTKKKRLHDKVKPIQPSNF